VKSKTKSAASTRKKVFTEEEMGAMQDRIREERAATGRSGDVNDESAALAKISELSRPDRAMAERIHAVVKKAVPALAPKLWYGMPAYYKDGKLLCHFQPAQKFKTRYATLGFSDMAKLDEGSFWPVAYALPPELTKADEARIAALVKKAAS
jgi:uncharacterized protein YdhG (YjbR/CyaY superfamily)